MEKRNSTARWIPLGILLALLLTFDVIAAISGAPMRAEYFVGISIGLFFAQIVATAVATTLLSVHPITRIISGALTTLLVAAALVLHLREARQPVPLILAATIFCQWLIYQIPLWSFRLNGWSLVAGDNTREPTPSEAQFGLRQIFAWTAITAVFLAIARLVAGFAQMEASPFVTSVDWTLFGVLTFGNSILVLPMMWGVFVRHQVIAWILGSVIWAVVLSPIQIYVISRSIPMTTNDIWLFVNINAVQFFVATLLLLALRFTGLRLYRRVA